MLVHRVYQETQTWKLQSIQERFTSLDWGPYFETQSNLRIQNVIGTAEQVDLLGCVIEQDVPSGLGLEDGSVTPPQPTTTG